MFALLTFSKCSPVSCIWHTSKLFVVRRHLLVAEIIFLFSGLIIYCIQQTIIEYDLILKSFCKTFSEDYTIKLWTILFMFSEDWTSKFEHF